LHLVQTESGVAVKVDGGYASTGFKWMLEAIDAGLDGIRAGEQRENAGRVLAPLRPRQLVFTGINYASHKDENPDAVFPDEPVFFAKLPRAVIGPGESIVIPYADTNADYEVELAVVIGKTARRLTRANALEHVFGYTVANDVSARDVQFRPNQLMLGKSPDTFAPLGPGIVTSDEIPDPSRLHVRTEVNGEERQSSPTAEMLFDVPTILETLTRYVTLEPGDVVTTGTPAGVAAFRPDKPWLKPGDVVTVEVDAIGKLTNPVEGGW
jgi:2-keto-4-pentenoate hydratase/2-oxohepta-3-ene-1,7-dioic acid hydratase in catechol pathway